MSTSAVPLAALLAVVLAAAAVAVGWAPSGASVLRWRLGSAGGGGRAVGVLAQVRPGRFGLAARGSTVLPAVAAAAAVLVVRGLSGALLALTAGLAGWAVAWLRDRGRRHRAGEERRRQSVEACDALVAELLAGRTPGRALARVAEDHPALAPAARACDLGGDVPAALRAGDLPALAAAWQVAQDCGCPLAPTLERVADALRAEEATRTEVASALAPARATARLLAVLPVFGLLLGAGLGGDPLGLLLGSPAGHGLLLGGVLLSLTGTVWVERIAGEVQVS